MLNITLLLFISCLCFYRNCLLFKSNIITPYVVNYHILLVDGINTIQLHWLRCQFLLDLLKRVSRARFKYALRYTKHIEDTARADALAKDLCDNDHDDFWKGVMKLN